MTDNRDSIIQIFDIDRTLAENVPFSPLSDGEIRVWFIPTDHPGLLKQTGVLSKKEQKKAAGYKNPSVKMCYEIGHTALRLLLARCQNTAPECLSFVYGPKGKPALSDSNGVHFNISHSGDWIALAVSQTPVGVDIEYARDTRKTDSIVRRFFHPQEAEHYRTLSPEEQRRFFYERWTAREAALKALGIGLTVEINEFLVERCPDRPLLRIAGGPPGSERLLLTGFDCPKGYVGCCAWFEGAAQKKM